MDLDRQADITALDTTLTTVEQVIDVEGLRARIEKLETEASDPNLWDDQARAQKVTSELSHAQGELRRVEELRQRVDDLPVLYELAAEEEGQRALTPSRKPTPSSSSCARTSRRWRSAPCCRVSTTSARPSSPSAPVRAVWTPPTGPRC